MAIAQNYRDDLALIFGGMPHFENKSLLYLSLKFLSYV